MSAAFAPPMPEILNSDEEGSQEEFVQDSWIVEYLAATGHDLFAEVSEEFIEDDFNLTGLGALVPHYHEALEVILDLVPEYPIKLPNVALIEHSAEILYGLIHARFITSRQGLSAMFQKYEYGDFGNCPRVLCEGTGLLPVGRHDLPGCETVRLCCPCCQDLYNPQSSRYMNVDGAFFGTSFAGLFLKTYPMIERKCAELRKEQFQLTIYGFNISEYSSSGPRMKWLRQMPKDMGELDAFSSIGPKDGRDEDGDEDEDEDEDEDDYDEQEQDDENAMQVDSPSTSQANMIHSNNGL